MKILKYRTIEEIYHYAYYSLEAEVKLDNCTIVFCNISVNKKGNPEFLDPDGCDRWTYKCPLDKVEWDHVEDFYYELTEKEDYKIFSVLVAFWNRNPVFVNDYEWKTFPEENIQIILKDLKIKAIQKQVRICLDEIYKESITLPENFGKEILEEVTERFLQDGYEITKKTVLEEMLYCYMCKMQ